MKLKKIASLALAGVMAVSMLAGCSVKGTGTNNNEPTVTSSSSMVDAANENQTGKAKVTFTADSKLTKTMQQLVADYGVVSAGLPENNNGLSALKAEIKAATGDTYGDWADLKTASTVYSANDDLDGESYTALGFAKVLPTEVLNAEAAAKKAAADIDANIKTLATTTYDKDQTANGAKYYDYSYTGTVSDLISVKDLAGQTTYYVVFTVTQTVATKTNER